MQKVEIIDKNLSVTIYKGSSNFVSCAQNF